MPNATTISPFMKTALVAASTSTLGGCALIHSPVLDPAGPVALAERDLLIWAFAVMMIVAIPVFAMTAWFATRYRASNTSSAYEPDWCASTKIEIAIWTIPAMIVVALGILLWNATDKLDPYRSLTGSEPAMKVQAIALDWRWLFIYPKQGIATINELVIPRNEPVDVEITSDTVMTALYIPRLAGQIYAMAGMRTRLNLRADKSGTFTGRNSQYNGKGFSDQKFAVRSVGPDDFKSWVASVKASPDHLDATRYAKLADEQATSPVEHFSSVPTSLFADVIKKHTDMTTRVSAEMAKRPSANAPRKE